METIKYRLGVDPFTKDNTESAAVLTDWGFFEKEFKDVWDITKPKTKNIKRSRAILSISCSSIQASRINIDSFVKDVNYNLNAKQQEQ